MSNKQRIYNYDLLRAIAVISIIVIHASDCIAIGLDRSSLQWWYGTIVQIMSRIGLPIFFVISGALILNSKDESLSKFYSKRFIKIIIPLVVYSFIYLFVFNYKFSIFNPRTIIQCFLEILRGPVFYHLWFVYTIVGIYIACPFIKIMLKNMSDLKVGILIAIMIIVRGIDIYLPALGINVGFTNFIFDGWILYFILGYFLSRTWAKNNKKIIYILGMISGVITITILAFIPNLTKNIFDLSPTMIFMTSAVFTYFIHSKERKKINRVWMFISKYSYSIYLIHAFVLSYIVNGKLNMSAITINPVIGLILTVSITLISSIILVLIIDNSIIKIINKIIYFFINKKELKNK